MRAAGVPRSRTHAVRKTAAMESFRPLREVPQPDRLTPMLMVITILVLFTGLFFLVGYWRYQGIDEEPAATVTRPSNR